MPLPFALVPGNKIMPSLLGSTLRLRSGQAHEGSRRHTGAFLVRRGGHGRRRCNCFHNLWRQAEANVLRHDFHFLQIVKALRPQKLDYLFDQAFRSRRPGCERNGLHAFDPFRLNIFAAVYQMRSCPEIARYFNQSIGIRTVLRADDQQQFGVRRDVLNRHLSILSCIADILRVGPFNVGELAAQGFDDVFGLVETECGLGEIGDAVWIGDR